MNALHLSRGSNRLMHTNSFALVLSANMIRVHRDLQKLPHFSNAVVTIGTFDGVHLGHQLIIRQLLEEAGKVEGESVIITFHPHPRKVIAAGSREVKVLNTLDEKIALLDKFGLHHVVVVPFTDAFSNMSAESYITDFLVHHFRPHTIIIGYDHKFGKDRLGDYRLLERMGIELDYHVKEIPERVLNEITISSTKIREALLRSDVETANAFLGYPYCFDGRVIRGNQLGRTIGFPTANLAVENAEKLIPGNGVYAVRARTEGAGTWHKGMMNIGVRPTIGGQQRTLEVNLFDFDEDIYDRHITVCLHHLLRGEMKFENLDQLSVQLQSDRQMAIERLQGL